MNHRLILSGLEAADYILTDVLRFPITKVLDPLDPADFLTISQRLATALQGLTGPAEAAALRTALNTLDVDWAKLDGPGRAKVLTAAKAAIASPPVVWPKVEHELVVTGDRVINGAKVAVTERYGFTAGVTLTDVDTRVSAHAAAAQGFYVKDEYGRRAVAAGNLAAKVIASGLDKGLGRQELGKQLEAQMTAQSVNRSRGYWNMVAAAHVNRSRVYGSLTSYTENGIEEYEFDAIVDELTTVQCRFMHGKKFRVETALTKYAEVAASNDPEDVKTTMPWLRSGKNDEGQEVIFYKDKAGQRQTVAHVTDNAMGKKGELGSFSHGLSNELLAAIGANMPPLHGNCRSTIVPVTDIVVSHPGPEPAPEAAPPPPPPVAPPPAPPAVALAPPVPEPEPRAPVAVAPPVVPAAPPKPVPQEIVPNYGPNGSYAQSTDWSKAPQTLKDKLAASREPFADVGEFAKVISDELGKKKKMDGAVVRLALRREIASVYDGQMASRPLVRERGGADQFVQDGKLGKNVFGANDMSTGKVHIASDTMAQARSAATKIAAMRAQGKSGKAILAVLTGEECTGLNVLIHEELHSMSPCYSSAYVGYGVGLEEAATESLARRAMRKSIGVDNADLASMRSKHPWASPQRVLNADGSTQWKDDGTIYSNYRAKVMNIISKHAPLEAAADEVERVELAYERTRAADKGPFEHKGQHLDAFLDALDVPEEKKILIRSEMEAEL